MVRLALLLAFSVFACEASADVLWDQLSAGDYGSPSQDFEEAYDCYDCLTADDFEVPEPGWVIEAVEWGMFLDYWAQAPVHGIHIYIMPDRGDNLGDYDNPVYYEFAPVHTVYHGTNTVTLATPVVLEPGHYFFGAAPALDFESYGACFFAATTCAPVGQEMHMINPGGCWGYGSDWFQQAPGYDASFRLYGQVSYFNCPDAVIDSPVGDVLVSPGDYVEFAGTATDGNGHIVDWLWTFGEGSGIDDVHVEDPGLVQFNNVGVFTVTFNAQDNDGNWDPTPDQRVVSVKEVVYVDCDAPGPTHDGVSWDTAYLTIQEGVNDADPLDEQIWVADGTYVENVIMGEGVAVYGGFLGAEPGGYETELDQRDFVNHIATIDGNQSGSCVVMAVDSTVDGFTIANGSGTLFGSYGHGGGLFCSGLGQTGVIANNTITGNWASYGGGIYCSYYSSPTVADNTITGNWASYGGGIFCDYYSSPAVTYNTITGNSATYGGGIFCYESSSLAVTANTISGNDADYGGGIDCSYSSMTLVNNVIAHNAAGMYGGAVWCWTGSSVAGTNNTIAANSATNGRALACDSDQQQHPSVVRITNCILWDGGEEIRNSDGSTITLTYGDVWGGWSGEGNIDSDPMFADPDAGDFHIQQGSPCIDAGDDEAPGLPEYDFEGDPRVLDGDGDEVAVVDIGADEHIYLFPPDAAIDLPTDDVTILRHESVEFAGTATDANGQIVDWLWTFGEGSGIDDIHVEDPGLVQFDNLGVFTVTFNAQDDDGNWDPTPDGRTVTVEPCPPDAVIDLPTDDVTILRHESVEFAGTATDANGQIVDWLWTFGEGSGIDDIHVEDPGLVQFDNVGVFTVTFNAQDDDGNWDPEPDTRTVTVFGGQTLVYVDRAAPGPQHDGLTWDTGFLTIQNGVYAATPGGDVWVADGAYVENVLMYEGVAIYGGFLGAEEDGYEIELGQRDFANNVTTIDGNQSGSCVVMAVDARVDGFTITNGSGTVNPYGNRAGGGFYCYQLGESGVITNNIITTNSAQLGGGIGCYESSPAVTSNVVTSNSALDYGGGGMYCYMSSSIVRGNLITENSAMWEGGGIYGHSSGASLTITDNSIVDNTAGRYGSGIYCYYSSPTITNNTISGNSADEHGGGIDCRYYSAPIVMNNAIVGNSAQIGGGGIFCNEYSSPVIANNMIAENSAGVGGGGIICYIQSSPLITNNIITNNTIYGDSEVKMGGGILCGRSSCSPVVTNNMIYGNSATEGGGIFCYNSSSPPLITNNTIYGNWADVGGGIFCSAGSSPAISNNIVALNTADVEGGGICCAEYSSSTLSHNDFWNNSPQDYSGCEPGEGDISADPFFVNPDAADFHLTGGSPCIGTGTNEAPGLPEADWDDEDRIANGIVDIGADEFFTWTATAPDPQPECDGPLFGEPQAGYPGWIWFSIPLTPMDSGDPGNVLGFACNGKLYRYDKYMKAPIVYQPPFSEWELAVGNSYILWLDSEVSNPLYEGLSPFTPWEFEFKLGRQGWTWIGMPGLAELGSEHFMSSVEVKYPSDETGAYRTAQADYDATPDNWITWGWPYWNTWLQAPETFTPYAPFGHNTCYPWVGYRVWVKVGTATDEDDPDQVTLIWPKQ